MSFSNLRVIAVGIAAIIAVLTGIAGGWVGARTGTCVQQVQSVPTDKPPGQGMDQHSGEAKAAPGTTIVGQSGACDATFSVTTAAIGFVGAALAGGVAAGLLLLGRGEEQRRRGQRSAVPTVVSAPPTGGGDPGLVQRLEQSEAERGTLVQTCIYVRDRATSKAIADTLGRTLQEVGVSTVAPVGSRFDPAHHEAGGATPTTDPAQVGAIAAVEIPGYVDRGVVLRAPVVTVYREEGNQ